MSQSRWFSVSFVSAEGRFRMEFNYSAEGLAFMRAAQEAAGASGFVVVEQPCHYSPWGLEQMGFHVPAVSAALSQAAAV
jgi:hypothetical protein